MSIQDKKITDAAVAAAGVQSRPDKLTGTAAQNKKVFDNLVTAVVKTSMNGLIDELTGTGAAAQLGIQTIPGFSAADIQTALEEIVAAMQDVTQGAVPNKSITLSKLAEDVTAAALGGAAASHTHGAADVSSGVLDIARLPALTGDKLPDGIVTEGKLGAASVTSAKLAALSVLAAHIAKGAVTGQKIADKTITAAQIADKTITGGNIADKTITVANMAMLDDNAGAHNSIYRGRNLGSSVTAAQWAAIEAGTFDDLYIGDYWVINNVTYRIAAFDYYFNTGNVACTTHHVVIVPDANMYTAKMNETATATGGYVGSKMYTANLAQAKTTINSAFGSSHILSHRQYLCNAVTDGKPSGGSWYDSTVELMTEQNVYGGKIFGVGNVSSVIPNLHTIDTSQFPLFAHDPSMIANRQWFWLRDVVSAADFAFVYDGGNADYGTAANARGVRPAFSIKA